MKQIKTEDAVGAVLCHDITEIVRGVRKGARFRKGHIVKEEDIPVLLSLGKCMKMKQLKYYASYVRMIICLLQK